MATSCHVVNVRYKRLPDQNVAHICTACIELGFCITWDTIYRITIYNQVFWALNQHNIEATWSYIKAVKFRFCRIFCFFQPKIWFFAKKCIFTEKNINLIFEKKNSFFEKANGGSRFSASWPFWPLLTLNDLSELTNQKVAGLKICRMKSCTCRCLICWNCPNKTEVMIKCVTPTPIFYPNLATWRILYTI